MVDIPSPGVSQVMISYGFGCLEPGWERRDSAENQRSLQLNIKSNCSTFLGLLKTVRRLVYSAYLLHTL